MELENLRLQILHIVGGDIEKAQEIESYVLGQTEKVTEPQAVQLAPTSTDAPNVKPTDAKGNTGNCNTGDCNTGNCNTGNCNTGNCNTGDCNTGHCNTGDCNTGNCNTGDCNTGNRNTGHWNTGNRNTGHWNTGDWNTTNFSNGFFNTEEVEIINVFDKPCMKSVWDEVSKPGCLYFSLTQWIDESEMSDVEKQENPSFSCTGGYLKKYDYKEAFTKSVTEASKEERDLIRALPNFNNEKFLEISGVDLSQLD